MLLKNYKMKIRNNNQLLFFIIYNTVLTSKQKIDLLDNFTEEEILQLWEDVKAKWDGKEIDIVLDLNPKTDDRIWWLNIPNEEREGLQAIRNELGLGRPYFGMHMSVGYANEKNIDHSVYIHELI
jgi:hypothetical protein